MGIEATSSATISVASTSQNTATSGTSSKANGNTSFKDEMSKVSNTEEKQEKKEVSEKSEQNLKSEASKEKSKVSSNKTTEKKSSSNSSKNNQSQTLDGQIAFNTQLSLNEANMMLTGDIQQMIENATSINALNSKSWFIGFGETKTNLSMNESDAEFFLNLTEKNDISLDSIVAQGQNMLNNGAEASGIAQNVKVSQALLNALNEARQNNQPIRIDFDQNISVILRVGRDGAISAQFIPGDKIAEQYLRQNINELKSSFDEQELPYTELSYSNSSKEQNQRRREQNQKGE